MPTLRDDIFANQPRSNNLLPQEVDALAASGMGDLRRGWESGRIGNDLNPLRTQELDAQIANDLPRAQTLRNQIGVLEQRQQMYAPRVGDLRDIHGVGDGLDWFAGQVGQGAASMIDPMAVSAGLGTVGRVANAIPHPIAKGVGLAATGASMAVPVLMSKNQLTGEFIGEAQHDKELMANTSPQRLRDMAGNYGMAAAIPDSFIPGMVGRQLVGATARKAGEQALLGAGGKTLMGMGAEGTTEGGQAAGSQYARGLLNPNRDTSGDNWDIINNAAGGFVGAGPFSGAGALAESGHSRVNSGVDAVKNKTGEVVDLLNDARNSDTGKKVERSIKELWEGGKAKTGDVIDLAKEKATEFATGEDGSVSVDNAVDNVYTKYEHMRMRKEDKDTLDSGFPEGFTDLPPAQQAAWLVKDDAAKREVIDRVLERSEDPEAKAHMAALQAGTDPAALDNALDFARQITREESTMEVVKDAAESAASWAGELAGKAARGAAGLGLAAAKGAMRGATGKRNAQSAGFSTTSYEDWQARRAAMNPPNTVADGVQDKVNAGIPGTMAEKKAKEDSYRRAVMTGEYLASLVKPNPRIAPKPEMDDFVRQLGYEITDLADSWGAAGRLPKPTDAAAIQRQSPGLGVNLDNIAAEMNGVLGEAAGDALAFIERTMNPKSAPMFEYLRERLISGETTAGRMMRETARNLAKAEMAKLLPRHHFVEVMQAGPHAMDKVFRTFEKLSRGRAKPNDRELVDELLGPETVNKIMELVSGLAVEGKPEKVIEEGVSEFDKAAGEKKLTKGSSAIYGFGAKLAPRTGGDIFARTNTMNEQEKINAAANGEDITQRPRLFKGTTDGKTGKVTGTEMMPGDPKRGIAPSNMLDFKIAEMEKRVGYVRGERTANPTKDEKQEEGWNDTNKGWGVDTVSAHDAMEGFGPTRKLALYRDYLRQESSVKEGKTQTPEQQEQAARSAAIGRLLGRIVAHDKKPSGPSSQWTERQNQEWQAALKLAQETGHKGEESWDVSEAALDNHQVKTALAEAEAFFRERHIVRAYSMTDNDPSVLGLDKAMEMEKKAEKIEDSVRLAADKAERRGDDEAANKLRSDANLLYFTRDGKEFPIAVRDLVMWARKAKDYQGQTQDEDDMNRSEASENGRYADAVWAGVSEFAGQHADGMPYKINPAGEKEYFEVGKKGALTAVPDSLMLQNKPFYQARNDGDLSHKFESVLRDKRKSIARVGPNRNKGPVLATDSVWNQRAMRKDSSAQEEPFTADPLDETQPPGEVWRPTSTIEREAAEELAAQLEKKYPDSWMTEYANSAPYAKSSEQSYSPEQSAKNTRHTELAPLGDNEAERVTRRHPTDRNKTLTDPVTGLDLEFPMAAHEYSAIRSITAGVKGKITYPQRQALLEKQMEYMYQMPFGRQNDDFDNRLFVKIPNSESQGTWTATDGTKVKAKPAERNIKLTVDRSGSGSYGRDNISPDKTPLDFSRGQDPKAEADETTNQNWFTKQTMPRFESPTSAMHGMSSAKHNAAGILRVMMGNQVQEGDGVINGVEGVRANKSVPGMTTYEDAVFNRKTGGAREGDRLVITMLHAALEPTRPKAEMQKRRIGPGNTAESFKTVRVQPRGPHDGLRMKYEAYRIAPLIQLVSGSREADGKGFRERSNVEYFLQAGATPALVNIVRRGAAQVLIRPETNINDADRLTLARQLLGNEKTTALGLTKKLQDFLNAEGGVVNDEDMFVNWSDPSLMPADVAMKTQPAPKAAPKTIREKAAAKAAEPAAPREPQAWDLTLDEIDSIGGSALGTTAAKPIPESAAAQAAIDRARSATADDETKRQIRNVAGLDEASKERARVERNKAAGTATQLAAMQAQIAALTAQLAKGEQAPATKATPAAPKVSAPAPEGYVVKAPSADLQSKIDKALPKSDGTYLTAIKAAIQRNEMWVASGEAGPNVAKIDIPKLKGWAGMSEAQAKAAVESNNSPNMGRIVKTLQAGSAGNPLGKPSGGTLNIWSGSGENAELSNLAARPFTFEGHKYLSVEHAYQSLKSGKFDQATYSKYTSAGRKIPGAMGTKADGGWNLGLMKHLISESFSQNPTARAALLATGSATLTHTQDRGVWATEFPRILTEVRKELSTGSPLGKPGGALNAQTPDGEHDLASAGEIAASRAWLEKVAPGTIFEMIKEEGFSGEFVEATNTVRVAYSAAAGILNTTYHEGLHKFFAQFVRSNPALQKKFDSLVNDERVKNRIHALLEGYPAAQAQLADGEERLAYAFQFWKAGLLRIDNENRSILQKVGAIFRRVFGMVRDSEHALAIFQAFDAGKLAKPSIAAQVIAKQLGKGTMALRARRGLDGLMQGLGAAVLPAEVILGSNEHSPTARRLGAIMFTNPGKESAGGGQVGYLNAKRSQGKVWANRANEVFENMDEADISAVQKYMQAQTDVADIKMEAHREAVTTLRTTMKEFHTYLRESGLKIGEVDKYYPVVWSVDALHKNKAKFIDMLVTKYPTELNASNGDLTAAAERIHAALIARNGVDNKSLKATREDETGVKEVIREDGVLSPFFAGQEGRILWWLKGKDSEEFQSKSITHTLSQYFRQGVRAAEYRRRFGESGVRLEAMIKEIRAEITNASREVYPLVKNKLSLAPGSMEYVNDQRQIANRNKWVARQMRDISMSVGAIEGTLGKDITPNMRKFTSYMIAYQNVRLLPYMIFSSFVDPLAQVARGAPLNAALETFTYGMREVFRSWADMFRDMPKARQKDEWTKLAEHIGAIEVAMFNHHVADEYSSVYMSPVARKINETLFKMNGMEAWDRANRTMATKWAVRFIEQHAGLPDKNHSARWLEELGLSAATVPLNADGQLITTAEELSVVKSISPQLAKIEIAKVHAALNRWVEGAVISPNAAQRPGWSSDPNYASVFHLKQFSYSFQQTIMQRAVNEMGHGNLTPITALAGFVPTMLVADIMKGLLQGGGTLPAYIAGMDIGERIGHAVERSGVMGTGDIVGAALQDWSSLGGPAFEQIVDGIRDSSDRTLTKAIPLHAMGEHLFSGRSALEVAGP